MLVPVLTWSSNQTQPSGSSIACCPEANMLAGRTCLASQLLSATPFTERCLFSCQGLRKNAAPYRPRRRLQTLLLVNIPPQITDWYFTSSSCFYLLILACREMSGNWGVRPKGKIHSPSLGITKSWPQPGWALSSRIPWAPCAPAAWQL